MSIDWFTFVAQLVNFLILVALLHRFLYSPIVGAMQQREQQIALRLQDADRKCGEADAKVRQYANMTGELAEQREELLRAARREASEERERLEGDARRDVQRKRDEWVDAVHRERADLLDDFRSQSAQLSITVARQMLRKLANTELEQQMFSMLLDRMQHLDDQRRAEIVEHLADGDGEVLVRSAFDVPDDWQARLSDVIRETFKYDDPILFETSSELICGVELDIGGYTFGWNITELLQELSFEMMDRLKARA